MAKKKGSLRHIHISVAKNPKGQAAYSVSAQHESEPGAMGMSGDEPTLHTSSNSMLSHVRQLANDHESGMAGPSDNDADDMPAAPAHPLKQVFGRKKKHNS